MDLEVNIRNAVEKNVVVLTDRESNKCFFTHNISKIHWINPWYANVTFSFRGQEFTVGGYVKPKTHYDYEEL